MMSNLFPTFKTFLVQGKKAGKLAFVKLAGLASDPNIPVVDSVIEPDFTRAQSSEDAAKSGRIAIDEDGNFVELELNEAAWTFPIGGKANGWPVLSFKPTAKNEFENFDPTGAEGASTNVTYTPKDWGFGPLLQNSVVFGDNTAQRLHYGGNSLVGENHIAFYIEMDDGGEPEILQTPTQGDLSIVIEGGVSGITVLKKQITDTVWRVTASKTAALASANNGVIKYTSQSDRGFVISGFTMVQGTTIDLGDIPTAGIALTRQNDILNDIVFTPEIYPSKEEVSIFWQIGYKNYGSAVTSRFALAEVGNGSKISFRESSNGLLLYDLLALEYVTINGNNSFLPINELGKFVFHLTATGIEIWYKGRIIYTASGDYRVDTMGSGIPLNMNWVFNQMAFNPTLITSNQSKDATTFGTIAELAHDLNYTVE